MGAFLISGGNQLRGELKIQGAKNAVLPVIAGAVLNKGVSYIYNCPRITDVENMLNILRCIGCKVIWEKNKLIIDSKNIDTYEIPEKFVREMRSSIILLGSVLGRLKKVKISFPGGCSIGTRPIDLHLKALKKMNVDIKENFGYIECSSTKIIGKDIILDYPSVGATENIMLAAVLSDGVTRIKNAAKEPEIVELECYLNKMGAKIKGAGTDEIVIKGVSELHDVEYTIMSDRIVAGTYMIATAITNGKVVLRDTINTHFSSLTSKLREIGCSIKEYNDAVEVDGRNKLKSVDIVRTQPYPGFPTDMQSQILSLLTVVEGTSIITENIFEARFKNANELTKMGAEIIIEGKTAIIKGIKRLSSAELYSKDLRGGAGLVIAGLNADGISYVHDIHYILRGYEDIVSDLQCIGADIKYVDK